MFVHRQVIGDGLVYPMDRNHIFQVRILQGLTGPNIIADGCASGSFLGMSLSARPRGGGFLLFSFVM
jgi:hypothetical protein